MELNGFSIMKLKDITVKQQVNQNNWCVLRMLKTKNVPRSSNQIQIKFQFATKNSAKFIGQKIFVSLFVNIPIKFNTRSKVQKHLAKLARKRITQLFFKDLDFALGCGIFDANRLYVATDFLYRFMNKSLNSHG